MRCLHCREHSKQVDVTNETVIAFSKKVAILPFSKTNYSNIFECLLLFVSNSTFRHTQRTLQWQIRLRQYHQVDAHAVYRVGQTCYYDFWNIYSENFGSNSTYNLFYWFWQFRPTVEQADIDNFLYVVLIYNIYLLFF